MSPQRRLGGVALGLMVATAVASADAAPRADEPASEAPQSSEPRDAGVHGEVRLGVGFGMMMEDPFATLEPAIVLDLRERAALQIGLGAPLRLRLHDRDPVQGSVLRQRDWDEPGDFVAILERVHYVDEHPYGTAGQLAVDLRVGTLGRVELGHGSIVRGYSNSLDLDRRRSGLDLAMRVQGRLLEQPAELDVGAVAGDLAGMQLFGGRVGGRWAGAGLGFSVVGDPTAPQGLERDTADDGAFVLEDHGGLVAAGRRGALLVGLDVSYQATDGRRWLVLPYLDLALMPNAGRGLHLGIKAEVAVGKAGRLGPKAEMTVGDADYDPAYFDVFYVAQRWQMPFVADPAHRPDDLGTEEMPKQVFVRREDLSGIGGYGALRFAHGELAFAEVGYHFRPGPLGGTIETRMGVDLEAAELLLLHAHRGRHGFELHELAGTLGRLDMRIPIIAHLDFVARGGWLFAVRPDSRNYAAAGPVGTLTSAGFFDIGVAGRIPW